MHGVTPKLVLIAAMVAGLYAGGCAPSGVGDPCIPESIPEGGFNEDESYVEASSVQCRSRLCIVHKLAGDPSSVCPTDGSPLPPGCVPAEALNNKVYCTCRCDAPQEVKDEGNFGFCSCPSGFSCEEVLALGGNGIRGNYCVRDLDETQQ